MAAAKHKAKKPVARKKVAAQKRKSRRYWSGRVTRESDALDLRKGVFSLDDPKKIAASLKRSAEESTRRKAEPYRSALSMLTFYINRAGKNLPEKRKQVLQRAKSELKRLFGRA
jgi:putative cell wall-binding protein